MKYATSLMGFYWKKGVCFYWMWEEVSLQWPHTVSTSSCESPTKFPRKNVEAKSVTVMKKQDVSLPEAMLVITRARLKRENPKILPSKIIIEMLNNDIWLQQLEMWQACKYNIYDNTIVNPNDPREKWIVQKVSESPQKKSSDVPPALKRLGERFPQIADQPHRLSTIEEVEEEVRRLSMIQEEDDKETRRLRTIEQDEARRLGSTSRATLRGVEFDMLS